MIHTYDPYAESRSNRLDLDLAGYRETVPRDTAPIVRAVSRLVLVRQLESAENERSSKLVRETLREVFAPARDLSAVLSE